MTKIDHVVARFNGADLTFRIARVDLELFERIFGPAFEAFKDVSSGKWTVSRVKDILAFSLLHTEDLARLKRTTERHASGGASVKDLLAALEGRPTERQKILHSQPIEAAFAKNAPGDYIPLVQATLAAAVLGIDEADAVFTDEPDGA